MRTELRLDLPDRPPKPRATGLTMMIDTGLPLGQFTDVVASFAPLVDVVKFGWGTSLVTPGFGHKVRVLQEAGVGSTGSSRTSRRARRS